jgi:RNA polymerase sigma-70 factor, ECF subfamily
VYIALLPVHRAPERNTDPQALTRRIREGDASAFEILFRAHYAELCAFVRVQVGSPDIAEELVQDVLLRIWHGRAQLDPQLPVRPYLYRAARNHALNYLTRRRVEDRSLHDTVQLPIPSATATDEAVRTHELSDAIEQAMASLPDRCRLIFLMSREHGMSYAAIADALGISIKTVETQMGRALKSLRASLAAFLL